MAPIVNSTIEKLDMTHVSFDARPRTAGAVHSSYSNWLAARPERVSMRAALHGEVIGGTGHPTQCPECVEPLRTAQERRAGGLDRAKPSGSSGTVSAEAV